MDPDHHNLGVSKSKASVRRDDEGRVKGRILIRVLNGEQVLSYLSSSPRTVYLIPSKSNPDITSLIQ